MLKLLYYLYDFHVALIRTRNSSNATLSPYFYLRVYDQGIFDLFGFQFFLFLFVLDVKIGSIFLWSSDNDGTLTNESLDFHVCL